MRWRPAWRSTPSAWSFGRQPTAAGLSEAVTEANTVVWEHSLENPELRGMGTTLTAAGLVNEDGRDVLALVNVGDSRSYRFHDGELTQLTTDHSLAEEMVRTGELTEGEAAVHPHRHILTRALGVSADVAVDLWRIQPVRGDRFLLCSDGLTNELDADQISEVLTSVPDPRRRPTSWSGRPDPRRQRQHHRGGHRRGGGRGRRTSPAGAVAAPADLTGVEPAVESSTDYDRAAAEVVATRGSRGTHPRPSRRERRRASAGAGGRHADAG